MKKAVNQFVTNKLIIRYSEHNGCAQEVWTHFYICTLDEDLLAQFLLLQHFFNVFRYQLAERYSRSRKYVSPIEYWYGKIFNTSFSIETVNPNDRINVKETDFKSSTISQFIGKELPHYKQIIRFLRQHEIFVEVIGYGAADWTIKLNNFLQHDEDAFEQVYRLIYRKFGDCEATEEIIIQKSRKPDYLSLI